MTDQLSPADIEVLRKASRETITTPFLTRALNQQTMLRTLLAAYDLLMGELEALREVAIEADELCRGNLPIGPWRFTLGKRIAAWRKIKDGE